MLALSRRHSMFGNGILNTDGTEWRAHRALIRPFFGEPIELLLGCVNDLIFFGQLVDVSQITDISTSVAIKYSGYSKDELKPANLLTSKIYSQDSLLIWLVSKQVHENCTPNAAFLRSR